MVQFSDRKTPFLAKIETLCTLKDGNKAKNYGISYFDSGNDSMSSSTNEASTSSSTSGRSSVTYERSDSKKSIKVDDLFAKFSFFSSESSPTPSEFSSAKSIDSAVESTKTIGSIKKVESSKNQETKSEATKLAKDSSLAQSSVKPQPIIKSNSSLKNESTSAFESQSKTENPKPKKTKNAQDEVKSVESKMSKKVEKTEKQTKKFEREFSTSSGVQGLGRLESKIRVLESTKMKDAYQKKDDKELKAGNPRTYS